MSISGDTILSRAADHAAVLGEALTLTDRMLAGARAGEWQEVLEADGRRREILNQMGLQGAAPEAALLEQLSLLHARNEELRALANDAMRTMQTDARRFSRRRRATRAYSQARQS